jgi:hypothetical protein
MPLKYLLEFKYPNNTATKATSVDEREYNRYGKCKKEIKIQHENQKKGYLEDMCENGTRVRVHWISHKVEWESVNSVGYGMPLVCNENGHNIQNFVKEGIFIYCSFVFSIEAVSHPST